MQRRSQRLSRPALFGLLFGLAALLFFLGALASGPPRACAQEEEQSAEAQAEAPVDPRQAEARDLFLRGSAMAAEERWAEALELFRRSESLVERASTRFNIAAVLARLGRYREALVTLRSLRELPPELTESAQQLRESLRGRVASLRLRVSPAEARVELDGDFYPSHADAERLIVLDPGEHVVRVSQEGYRPRQFRISALAGEMEEREVTLSQPEATVLFRGDATLPGAVIRVDGEIAGGEGNTEIFLTPGRHELTVRVPDRGTYQRDLELLPGESMELHVDLSRGSELIEDPVFWAIVGGSVAAVAAGIGIGVGVAEANSGVGYAGTSGIVFYGLSLP